MKTQQTEMHIYVWDTHWSERFIDFIEQYADWVTNFVLIGDIFDRWLASYQIIEKIKDLYAQWKIKMVLGNHDLFYIFWKLYNIWTLKFNEIFSLSISEEEYEKLNKLFKIYNDQYFRNWWVETNNSFKLWILAKNMKNNFNPENFIRDWFKDQDYLEEEYNKYCLDIAKFLFTSFDIFHIDELNNISIHWGINILPNWDLVAEKIDWEFVSWVERLRKYNEKLKNFDYEILKKLTAYFDNYKHQIFIEMKENWFINWKAFHNTDNTDYIPTWMPNYLIDKYEEVRETLIKELDENWLNRCIMGHYSNEYNKFNETPKNQRYYRIDRNFIWAWNFWVLILDKYWEVLKIDDVSNLI